MNPDIAKVLREPFPREFIGKLPRVWCRSCRDSRTKLCDQHKKVKCRDCGNSITEAHLHLDYVGHAEITDRLLQADPEWTWEPVAFGSDGLPLRDQLGGLWIRLTVADVTRLGYGHADGKPGPDAVKEAIGDALRNAAMRFGVALDLWGAKFKDSAADSLEEATAAPASTATAEQAAEFDKLLERIKAAGSEEDINGIGADVHNAKAVGSITKMQYERLARAASARLSQLAAGSS